MDDTWFAENLLNLHSTSHRPRFCDPRDVLQGSQNPGKVDGIYYQLLL